MKLFWFSKKLYTVVVLQSSIKCIAITMLLLIMLIVTILKRKFIHSLNDWNLDFNLNASWSWCLMSASSCSLCRNLRYWSIKTQKYKIRHNLTTHTLHIYKLTGIWIYVTTKRTEHHCGMPFTHFRKFKECVYSFNAS